MEQLRRDGVHSFKRSINQNYFNFIPIAPDDPRMTRLRRLVPDFTQNTLDRYAIEDPDRDPSSCTYDQLEAPVPHELAEIFGL